MRTYIHKLVVVGYSAFPVDMLRRDCCYPARESDQHAMVYSFDSQLCVDQRKSGKPFEVTVMKVTDYADEERAWTVGRWQSFGWKPMLATSERRK